MCQHIIKHYVSNRNLLRHKLNLHIDGSCQNLFALYERCHFTLLVYIRLICSFIQLYVWTFPKLHYAAEISFKNLYQNTYNNSQAAGWHMHANCRIPIRSCFLKSAFVSNVLLLKHFRHFSVHSFFQPDLSNIFLMNKYRQLYYITRSCGKHVVCSNLQNFPSRYSLYDDNIFWSVWCWCSCEWSTFLWKRGNYPICCHFMNDWYHTMHLHCHLILIFRTK